MAATKYTYVIATDFPNAKVAADRLRQEIVASAIVTALDYINTDITNCDVWFKDALSVGDVTRLDTLVAGHSGEPLPATAQPVAIDGVTPTADGRLTTRGTVAQVGKHRMRCVTFYTADPSKLDNTKPDGVTDYGDMTLKCYDVNGAEITAAPYTAVVKTVLDFEPLHNYEIIGGEVSVPPTLKDGTSDAWFASCVGVPDVPAELGGSVDFVNNVNLEAFDGILDIDGRATTYLTYSAAYHTNKVRFIFRHPAGDSRRFQIFLELFS
jgi:hypothetical protein